MSIYSVFQGKVAAVYLTLPLCLGTYVMKIMHRLGEQSIKRTHGASLSPPLLEELGWKNNHGKYLLCSSKKDEFSNHTGHYVWQFYQLLLYSVLGYLWAEHIALSHIGVSINGSKQCEDCVFGWGRLADYPAVLLLVIKCSFYSHFIPFLSLWKRLYWNCFIYECDVKYNWKAMQQKYQAGGLFLIRHFPVWLVLGGSGCSLCMEEVVALHNFQNFPKNLHIFKVFSLQPILDLASTVTAQKHPGALMFSSQGPLHSYHTLQALLPTYFPKCMLSSCQNVITTPK